ncbi:dynamin family protein [Nodularia sphaerocarpa]|uniref:dynamin family protein n=1 Tax=Nodularia sphaerocarpa TaxID=137816 RepID=UPI001EFA6734|nr:dynamin family protein [Nodularia sphaerocarpa]MDB9372304.1 dynamin family protein [Nodularia sphaerocarpa CS-585]MDB9376323.1 dynamin family protein [Nodularia sphaerocarpa CS-585A2]ULP74528.1 Bacterial dynamin-like protein [Nodularia sphaerocarpa UHCC 0038]
MDTSRVGAQTVELLSRITGKKLSQRDITPLVIFLANLVTLLLGVKVAESQNQNLLKILYQFSLPESDLRRLTHLMIKGVKKYQVYQKNNDLLTLAAPLSDSEKLLLINFGYQISAADGEMDFREERYLQMVANELRINPQHLAVLESRFTNHVNVEATAINEVHFLLNPIRFQKNGTIFIKAARDVLKALFVKTEHKTTKQQKKIKYKELNKFHNYYQQLDSYCYQIFQIIEECQKQDFLPHTLIEEISKVSKKLQSQRFRLAVVGEFSQGKSTLLNALLGEEIQPVREIPCSGAITVLKYGTQKRVICRYKDGQEEEIPAEKYQLKATISEAAAIGFLSDELAHSEIAEIVFEHPDLELCSSGVEIIDSPGLNEHPDRTNITQRLLKDTDAVIFLTNAARSFTQGERELLQDIKTQLNHGQENEPANNLFIVGNFIDLVRSEKGLEQVRQRIENFVLGQNPFVTGNNRVHLISAQATLDAILQGAENEYLKSFQNFIQSLEQFLTVESGKVKIQHSIAQINRIIQKSLDSLSQAEKTLDGKIKISDAEKLEILEKIGEASGRDVRIQILASNLGEEVYEEAAKSWDDWREELVDRMAEKSKLWYSAHNPVFSQDKLINNYTNQFMRDLSEEIDVWANEILKDMIIKESLESLDTNIAYEIEAIQGSFYRIGQQVETNFSERLKFSISGINDDFMGLGGIGGGLGIGGALAAVLLVFTGLGSIAIIAASVATAIASSFGLGMLDLDRLNEQIKLKVFEIGFEKLDESKDKISEKLEQIINTVFDVRVELASKVIEQAIALYENLLEQQEKAHQITLEEREAEKALIYQKRQQLENIKNDVQTLLTQCTHIA